MKIIKELALWIGCIAFALIYGAFVGYSLDEQIQIETPAVIVTANK